MNSTPRASRLERLHDRLTQSKYWSISLAVHAVMIAALSTLVLVKSVPRDVFVIEGTLDPIHDPKSRQQDKRPDERPEELNTAKAPEPKSPAPNVSDISKPRTAAPPTAGRLIVYIPTSTSTSEVPIGPGGVNPPIKAPAHVPAIMGIRFVKDGRNHVTMTGNGPKPTDATENAVLRGLNWLRDHQSEDGSWGEKNKAAMTGLALLAFLGHGETGSSKDYGVNVNKAIQWVLTNGVLAEGRLSMTKDNWGPGNGGVYEHGILTYALGEYYLLTQEDRVVELLRQAVKHIIDGQGPDGGWMYHYDKTQSDTSVSGWQVQALKAAHLTKLGIPQLDAALDRAMANFDRVQGPKGGYGYRTPDDRYSLSGVGILCELFWKEKRDGDMNRGIDFILEHTKQEPVKYNHAKADLYAWYYHTQATLMYGGAAWRKWESMFRPMAIASQIADGSWPPMLAAGHGNLQNDASVTGGVYRTTLNVLMLESYYRYLGLNQANLLSTLPQLAAR